MDLSAVDDGYTALYNIFSSRPIRRHEPSIGGVIAEVNKDRGGSVVVLDSVGGRLDLRQYMVSKENAAEDVKSCIKDIEQDLPDSHTRVIFVSYYRTLTFAGYSGLDVSILDAIGYKYKIHPEVYMWHFGSDYGIFNTYFPSAKPPLPSALSTQGFFHIWNHHSIISTHLHSAAGARRANADEAAIYDQNPVEYIIPFAQMSLVNGTFLMDIWDQKIEYNQEEGAINLEVRYDEQTWTVNHLRQNLQALETFTTDASSRRWKSLLPDYQRGLRDAEQQVIMLAQKMSYRASMASLRESQMAIEQAKTGIQQNERVKRLTQLAFIFIPLSFVTSLFGMNVTALGTGSATVWMVVVSIIITYVVITLFWILLRYQAQIVNWTAAKFRAAKGSSELHTP